MITTPSNEKVHETGTLAEYKKKLSIQERAKAAYNSAIRQNVFASFDAIESKILKKLPALF